MIVLGLCGSLRRGSHNRQLLDAAADCLPEHVTMRIFDGLADLPPYSDDLAAPDAVEGLRGALAGADAVLIATPEYNSSLPGVLKNALDWASRPFPDNALRDKAVAVIGASTGIFGAVWAQAETRKVIRAIGGRVLDEELPVGNAHNAFAPDGSLADPDQRSALAQLVAQLVREAQLADVR